MTQLAQDLIEENLRTKAPRLDLGNCGLDGTEPILDRLGECTHLEELIFSHEWVENGRFMESENQGEPNHLQQLPNCLPIQLRKLIACGWGEHWGINDLTPLYKLTSLTHLDLRENQLTQVPLLALFPELRYLVLSYNQLLHPPDLSMLTQLKQLFLSNNQLTQVPDLSKLTQLERLSLNNNNLKAAPNVLQLSQLAYLDLSANQLTIVSNLSSLTQLRRLDLDNNQLAQAPDLSKLTQLKYLTLSNNNLTKSPDLSKLTQLKQLYIDKNQLSKITGLGNLKKLTRLDLYKNQLTEIPGLEKLTQLQQLYIHNNQLTKIPDLSKFKELVHLYLYENQLSNISGIEQLQKLTLLYLRDNQLTSIPDLSNLKSLTQLNVSNNYLTSIPDLSELKNLTCINISNNQLSHIPDISMLKNLKEVSLSNNQFKDIRVLATMTQLTRLELSNNPIQNLSIIESFRNLKILILDGLNIKRITLEWLAQFPALEVLSLYDNPIQNIPPEVYNKESENVLEAVRDYLESLEAGSKPLHEAKLLLVGVGEVGKTELVKAISQPDYVFVAGQNSTQGIDITRWQLPQPPASVPDFVANIWDFAGQEVNYGTHQFFLTKNSVYVFVWDTRKGEAQSKFLYWLKVVTLLSKGAPIFVVQNKIDEYNSEIDQRSWKESFPNIVGFMKTSCKAGTGLAELRQAVATQLCALPHIGDLWNPERLEIRQAIERHPDNYLNRRAYLQICAAHQLDSSQAGFLSQQLHDLGVVLHYQEDPLLRDTVVLKPQWAIDAAYCVLNNKSIAQGKFGLDDLDHIWADACYHHKHPFLLRLMERFELIFKLANQHTYIVPELLPHEPSSEQKKLMPSRENAPRELFFEYQYDFMPEGIMPHFICRSHELIHQELFWKYGVVLRHQQGFALVLHNSAESFIRVHCWGAAADKLLFLIRNHFDHIHQRLNRPEVAEVIPCPCDKCEAMPRNKKEFFEESYLRMCLEEGDTDVRCSNRTKVSIQQLLEGIINESSTLQRRLLHLINTYQVDEFFVELKRQKIDNAQLASLRKRFIHDGGGFQFADQLKVWVLESVRF